MATVINFMIDSCVSAQNQFKEKKTSITIFKFDNNNCNLNLSMTSPQRPKISLVSGPQSSKLAAIEKLMQNHSDPHPKCIFSAQRTDNDDCLYEFQMYNLKAAPKQKIEEDSKTESKRNIEMTLLLTAQNDELARKIKEVKDAISSQELKGNIFKKKFEDNQQKITQLKETKERMLQETKKMKTLNQSYIPNKSIELNTTHSTNAWLNEFLNKSQLENLWSKQKEKESKNNQTKIKSYTIDLSTFMNSARSKQEKTVEKAKMNESKYMEEKLKSKQSSKIITTRPLSSKQINRFQMSQKQHTLNKNLSQLRNMKKTKCNPEL